MLHWSTGSESAPIKPVCCLHVSPRAAAEVARFIYFTHTQKKKYLPNSFVCLVALKKNTLTHNRKFQL